MLSFMHGTMVIPVVSFFILVFFLIKFNYFTRTSTKKNLPPSPPTLPVIGNFHQIGPLLHRSFHSLAQKYNTGPLMLVHLGSVPALVVFSADAAREILKTQDLIFASRPDVKVWRRILYDLKEVAVAPYGEHWRQVKSIMVLNFLSNKRVESYRQVREEEIAISVEKIKKCYKQHEAVDLSELFVKLTNNVLCRVTFGRTYSEGESGRKFIKMLAEFFEVLGGLNLEDLIPRLGWVNRLSGFDAKVERVAKEIDGFLEGVVDDRMKERSKVGGDGGGGDGEDFLDILLKIQKDDIVGLRIDRDCVKALLLDAYVAGTDTTATALEWTFTELLKSPRVLKKVQDEVRTILKNKEQIHQNDIDKMKYLEAVVKEAFRLHPPLPTLIARVATQDTKVMGYDVEKKTRVMVNAWAIGRDPKVWDKPNEFQPERFLDSSIDIRGHDFDLLPFGSGRRGCPGISFAMVTIYTVLAHLLNEFQWKLPNGMKEEDVDMTEEPGVTFGKKIPLLATASPFSS